MGYETGNSCPLCNPKNSKKVKVSTVCFEETVQSINDLTISAPVGIDIDDSTGKINSATHIEILSKPSLSASLENNVLIIEGLLHAKIIFENPKPCPCTDEMKAVCQEVFIPIQTVLKIRECRISNQNNAISIQTNGKVISTSIFGYPNKSNLAAGKQINLVVKAILEITTYIFEDEIINIPYCNSHSDKY